MGVEYLRLESSYVSDTDENHATRGLSLKSVENAWVRNVTARYFYHGLISVTTGGTYVTVQDSTSLDPKSQITGGRRYPFNLTSDASHVLVMRSYSNNARHDFVTGANTPGPNVFLDSRAVASYSELGPHQRWATGTLDDNITHNSVSGDQRIAAYNRGDLGTGHGWSGAYHVFYNCIGDRHKIDNPPHARNWSLGCRAGAREGAGTFGPYGAPVAPWSLYLQQLRDRLGDDALHHIGY